MSTQQDLLQWGEGTKDSLKAFKGKPVDEKKETFLAEIYQISNKSHTIVQHNLKTRYDDLSELHEDLESISSTPAFIFMKLPGELNDGVRETPYAMICYVPRGGPSSMQTFLSPVAKDMLIKLCRPNPTITIGSVDEIKEIIDVIRKPRWGEK